MQMKTRVERTYQRGHDNGNTCSNNSRKLEAQTFSSTCGKRMRKTPEDRK